MRCTTFTKCPVAFSGGSRLRREPLATANTGDLVAILTAIGVNAETYSVAWLHEPQLGFLEVRRDPDIIQRNNRHQLRPGRDIGASLVGLFPTMPLTRRDDRAIAKVELSLFDQRPSLSHDSFSALRARRAYGTCCSVSADWIEASVCAIGLIDGALRDADILFGFDDRTCRASSVAFAVLEMKTAVILPLRAISSLSAKSFQRGTSPTSAS